MKKRLSKFETQRTVILYEKLFCRRFHLNINNGNIILMRRNNEHLFLYANKLYMTRIKWV